MDGRHPGFLLCRDQGLEPIDPVRLDVFLHRVCILKSRTLAKEACQRGKVTLNGTPAKGSSTVRSGDRIVLDLVLRLQEFEVLTVPTGSVSRKNAPDHYEVLRDIRRDLDF